MYPENEKFSEILAYIKSEYYLFLELRDNLVYKPMSFLKTLSYVCDEYIYHLRNSFEAAEREREREKA